MLSVVSAIMNKLGETAITLSPEDLAAAPAVSQITETDGTMTFRIARDPDPRQAPLFDDENSSN